MQPYQEASKEIQRQGQRPVNALKTAASIGAGYAGGALLGRVMPLLSKYVPEDLAIKGLNKIDPRFGKFINTAMSNGTPFEEVKSFIEEKAAEAEQQEQPKEGRNIIQQYSDKLHEQLQNLIKKGMTPAQAVSLVDIYPHHKQVIEKIEKEHKVPFHSLVQSIYGGGDQALAQQGQQQQQPQQQPQQQSQQQSGQGQQALMAILQKIQQTRGG